METQTSVALIFGVTGMVGLSLAEALKKPTALGGPWTVYGNARSSQPSWFPPALLDSYLQFDIFDSEATKQHLSPISDKVTHIFWVTRKACETEEENVIANLAMVENVLKVLVSDSKPTLRHFSLVTGTKQYLGPIYDPILASQVIPHEAPFHEGMPRLPFPNFYYNLEDLLVSYHGKFTYSIHRSSIIHGVSAKSAHNALLTLIVYALIRKHEGVPFIYPGNMFMWEHFCDATDAELVAEQQIWASFSGKAHNEAFNCTNGDVYTWKSFWKLLCAIMDVEFVPYDDTVKFDLVEEMKDKGGVWDTIVQENQLFKTRLEDITCFDATTTVLNFKIQHVCSMTKSREFGFDGFKDTFKSVKKWVQRLREMKIIPKQ